MGRRVLIAPSILSADFSRLGEELELIERAGADLVHIDVMDGLFVPNITIGPCVISSIRDRTSLPFDVHLMIRQPERYLKEFADAGADIITVHYEATPHVHRALEAVKKLGLKSGVALNPGTPVLVVEDILDVVDMVLIMTVNPGFGGQSIIRTAVDKLDKLDMVLGERGIMVEVDGGVNKRTIGFFKGKRVDVIVSGSGVFKEKSYKEAISYMRRSLEKA